MKYYPYLRGKRFESLALRDMCSFIKDRDIIAPIIEPVLEGDLSFNKTIETLCNANNNFRIIINPECGKCKSFSITANYNRFIIPIESYDYCLPSIIINSKNDTKSIAKFITNYSVAKSFMLIIKQMPNNLDTFTDIIKTGKISQVLLAEDLSVRRLARNIKAINPKIEIISLSDPFISLPKNSDYLQNEDEFFSSDHIYFNSEGFAGYSDYVTVGSQYSESGFLPYAVVIHLTYFNERNEFRIHHFVSDNNDDTSDIAGKYGEAVKKIINPLYSNIIQNTTAVKFLIEHKEKFPGLGVLKKESILNHLELVYNYFTKNG